MRPTSRSLPDPVRAFLAYIGPAECGLAPATIAAYTADIRCLLESIARHRGRGILSVTAEEMKRHFRMLASEGHLCGATVARHRASIRMLYRFLTAMGYVDQDPSLAIEPPRVSRHLPGHLRPSEIQALLAAPAAAMGRLWKRDRALLETMYAAGLRASEVAGLGLEDLDSTRGFVKVCGKGGKERLVPLGMPALHAIWEYLDDLRPKLIPGTGPRDERRLFLSQSGRPLERVAVWQIVRRCASSAGLHRVHPHKIRHSFATDLLAGGANLRMIQSLLGHSDLTTTQVYTHLDQERLRSTITRCHPRG